ncbi:MAG: hypothetical protein QOF78_1972, partial [Phycisphaerales bacterium]|nr:hypothetical protein [Phycisphaerales bacterium]
MNAQSGRRIYSLSPVRRGEG